MALARPGGAAARPSPAGLRISGAELFDPRRRGQDHRQDADHCTPTSPGASPELRRGPTALSGRSARPRVAGTVLGERIASELARPSRQLELDDPISTTRPRWTASASGCASACSTASAPGQDVHPLSLQCVAADEYGIDVIDVRLGRANHPPTVRQVIFDLIASERGKKAAEYESEGENTGAGLINSAKRSARGRDAGQRRGRGHPDSRHCQDRRGRSHSE